LGYLHEKNPIKFMAERKRVGVEMKLMLVGGLSLE